MAGLLAQLYLSPPQLDDPAPEFPRAYALYRIGGRQRRCRNAQVVQFSNSIVKVIAEVKVDKAVFLPVGGENARACGDDLRVSKNWSVCIGERARLRG